MSSLRRLILWTAALAVALVGVLSVMSPTRAHAAETSSVVGKLVFVQTPPAPDIVFRFDVRGEGHHDDAEGTVRITVGKSWATADIECLVVDKTGAALLAGDVVKTNIPGGLGAGLVFVVEAPDHLYFNVVPAPSTCKSIPAPPLTFTKASKGHVKVHGGDEDEEDDD